MHPSLCFIRCCAVVVQLKMLAIWRLIKGKYRGRARCVFHLIAKMFSQNEAKVFIPHGGSVMSVTLNTHFLFFISALKNGPGIGKESVRLVD